MWTGLQPAIVEYDCQRPLERAFAGELLLIKKVRDRGHLTSSLSNDQRQAGAQLHYLAAMQHCTAVL